MFANGMHAGGVDAWRALNSALDSANLASISSWARPPARSMKLVFSDEFLTDGRVFSPGDDQRHNLLVEHSLLHGQISVILPGANSVLGPWLAVWTMANLGCAGYGASLVGVWPYSSDTCDIEVIFNTGGRIKMRSWLLAGAEVER
ncbi:hypothetical protein B0H13DRAFT_2333161 [Mycena leptocephala]|nr:hypothetical protein B0H13DRAFT_2333161 [Mycena leptocephala]